MSEGMSAWAVNMVSAKVRTSGTYVQSQVSQIWMSFQFVLAKALGSSNILAHTRAVPSPDSVQFKFRAGVKPDAKYHSALGVSRGFNVIHHQRRSSLAKDLVCGSPVDLACGRTTRSAEAAIESP